MKFRLLIITCLMLISGAVHSQTSKKIRDLESQRKAADTEIAITNDLLKETQKTHANALNRLQLLTRQIVARKQIIAAINSEISSIENEIAIMEVEVKTLERDLKLKQDHYAMSIRKMYLHRNSQEKLMFILSADNLAQSYRRLLYLKNYSQWQHQQAIDVSRKQVELQEKKEKLLITKGEKLVFLQEKEKEQQQLNKEEQNKQVEVQDLKKQEKKLQADLKKKQQRANELNRLIEKAIAEEVARAEKESQAQAKKSGSKTPERIAENKGGYAMTKEERVLSTNFAGNKGKLPYPLKGNYRIVSSYGVHQHAELKYVKQQNNGIDIQTSSGNEARAVFNGTVSAIFAVPGNNAIMVRHGNYITVYSNLSEIYVKKGDVVKTSQSIGKIDTDPENGTILHFELWKERTTLNPLSWLN